MVECLYGEYLPDGHAMKLQQIELTNFKSINQVRIDDLGPINVIFGPTNSGKTSLLEAPYFQFHHRTIIDPKRYEEFLHSKAPRNDSLMTVKSAWVLEEPVPALDLHPQDTLECITHVRFTDEDPRPEDQLLINGKQEGNLDRQQAAFEYLRAALKFSSSRRPGDTTKSIYFPGEESNEQRRQRFLTALQELKIQGDHYQEFLSYLQKMFPHLVYGSETERDIMDFFGMGFLGTAKLFVYLFDARYQVVLIDEPEIHFYPSLTRRFVKVLYEVVENLNKQILLATHSALFLQEKRLGDFYHAAKSKHFLTTVRKVDQNNLLEGLDILNAPPEAVLQSDIVIYAEGPSDIAVFEEWLAKFPELTHTNIAVFHLGGGSMGNINVDPLELKKHNPLSLVIIDSERTTHGGPPDAAHADFLKRAFNTHLYCLLLDRRAIENYFTPRALRVVFGKKVPSDFTVRAFKPLHEQGLPWYEKSWNRLVARAMTREEIESFPDLKKFFGEILLINRQVQ